jgi:hypothetical protein
VTGENVVGVGAVMGLGVGVDERGGQPRDGEQEIVLGGDCDLVGLHGGDVRVDDHFAFGADLVADPAQPYLPDI